MFQGGEVARAAGWALAVVGLGVGSLEAQIPWDESMWDVEARESRVETYQGREALYLRAGNAWLQGVEFQDGVIEFDVAAPAAQGFHGLRFRAVDRFNHEHVYLRPHLSGKPDAVQYNPIFNGVSGWQMYSDPRYALPATITPDRWVRVRVGVRGRRMEMTIDGEPLVFPDLVRDPVSGGVALNSSTSEARFANFVIRPGADPGFSDEPGAPEVPPEPGTVVRWRVSEPFPEEVVDGVAQLPPAARRGHDWATLAADVRGIANIAKLRARRDGSNTVFAAVTLRADEACTAHVRIGFSDRVRAFLNGRQLFAGADEYGTRDYRFLGTMGLFDELFLPLEEGDNELWLAVSENFGGWGVSLQVPDEQGVSVH